VPQTATAAGGREPLSTTSTAQSLANVVVISSAIRGFGIANEETFIQIIAAVQTSAKYLNTC
jgi:hypothetical protein